MVLCELGAGEVIGEMGLLTDAPRSATVTAVQETETLELSLPVVAVTVGQYPEVAAALLRGLSERLRDTTALAVLGQAPSLLGQAVQKLPDNAEAAAREEAAVLRGVLLAARTLEHYINNQLALTVGYCVLLANDSRLPADLCELAQQARVGALAAAALLQKVQGLTRVRELALPGVPPLLSLEQSAE